MESVNKSIAKISVEIPKGKHAVVNLVSKEEKPNFYMIGSGMGKTSIDAIDIFSNLTPQEWFVILTLKNVSGFIHHTKVPGSDKYITKSSCIVSTKNVKFTPTQKNQFSTGFKRLRDKGVVKRLKRQEYMINPDILIPSDYDEEKKLWEENQ